MPEPFKNLFNPEMIALMGSHFAQASETFDPAKFVAVATENIAALELKERSNQIRRALHTCLPDDFRLACDVLLAALHPDDDVDMSNLTMDNAGIRGWATMPMADYVGDAGLGDFDHGMEVLRALTKRGTSELAVRAFILHDPQRAMQHLGEWACDPNYHVRRLASEGCRPRLPWAVRLPGFITNPEPVIAVLALLKDDPLEYVRRSVANNLNDIAKDHPDRVAAIAADWMKNAGPKRKKLVRHACRTLVKQGHKGALAALGYGEAAISLDRLEIRTPVVEYGTSLEFDLALTSQSNQAQSVIFDYVIHHLKANGETSPKVFKGKTFTLAAGKSLTIARKHPMKPITTRVYYAGAHALEIQINGVLMGRVEFELAMG